MNPVDASIEVVKSHYFVAFIVSAMAASFAVAIQLITLRANRRSAAISALGPLLVTLREKSFFEAADAIVLAASADPWYVLGEGQAKTLAVLCQLRSVTGKVDLPYAYHACLSGSEWETTTNLLRVASPLIHVLRTTVLGVGANRPYNGDKASAMADAYRVFAVPLSGCG
ncbi:MAG: hypothetical protein LW892_13060, partial [Betaproteobacteria bacterium]|nr:hypothetical protein [Betaproteobacteria bacterium]